MANTAGALPAPRTGALRLKYLVFSVIGAMMAYVLYHNERFIIDAANPVWNHYEPFKWWLLPHGLAGACALILVPLQFAEGLRRRHTVVHRTIGTIYVIGVLILAPVGLYIQYLDEAQGAARSFTIETTIQSSTLITTTLFGLYFAIKRQFTYHRQWMIRSYAVALTFFEIRVILGVFGLDQPMDWHVLETVVWSCVASSVLVATSPTRSTRAFWQIPRGSRARRAWRRRTIEAGRSADHRPSEGGREAEAAHAPLYGLLDGGVGLGLVDAGRAAVPQHDAAVDNDGLDAARAAQQRQLVHRSDAGLRLGR